MQRTKEKEDGVTIKELGGAFLIKINGNFISLFRISTQGSQTHTNSYPSIHIYHRVLDIIKSRKPEKLLGCIERVDSADHIPVETNRLLYT